jgi:alpha-1,3-rhamnosyl/mannosyltransferase
LEKAEDGEDELSSRSKIKIGFDLSPLNDEATFGVCCYAINLLQELVRINDLDICLLYPWSLKIGQEEMSKLAVQRVQLQLRLLDTRWWEQLFLPILAARARCDAIHSLANVAPALSARPVVLTLHDIITYAGGANVSPAVMNYLRRYGTRGVQNAAAVITVSEHSRREIVNFFHIEDSKIHVVPNGVSQAFFDVAKNHPSPGKPPAILACGSLAPNKNLRVTLLAFAQVLHRFPAAKLILFSIAPNTEGLIEAMASKAGILASSLGFVHAPNDLSMSHIFADADLLLFPSLSEGFGLPVAEAFAAGLPVVTSNNGALSEVSGDAALLIDPSDATSLARATLGILENSELRNELRERGRQRSGLYTWARAAAKTTDVYCRVLGRQAT